MADFSRVKENEDILRQFEEKRSDTTNELRTLENRLETLLEGMTCHEITKSEGEDEHCTLNETPRKLEFMDSSYSYLLPSVETLIKEIPDSNLRWGLEYLLNDYRRMWCRRHSEGMQEDNLLAEVKMWTTDKRSNIVIPSSLREVEKRTERNKRDLTTRMEKLGDLQKSFAGIKDKFSKVSVDIMSHIQQEKDAYGFSFDKALKSIQEMSYDEPKEPDSVEDLIKRIDTLERLMEEQRLRLTDLFQADKDVNEKIHEARKILSDADAFQNDREERKNRIETLESDWFKSQESLFKKLSSYAETIASELKCHLCLETRNSIIAKESINEYERLLSAEKHFLDNKHNLSFKAPGTYSLLSSVSHPGLIKYVRKMLTAFEECKNVTLRMSKQTFDRLSGETKALQSSVTKDLMRASADNEIESDLLKLRYKMKDTTSFPSLILSLFNIMNRELKEYVRLLKVYRLRDVQMSTLVHNIDVVALSVARQLVSVKTPIMVSGTHTPYSALQRNGMNASFPLSKAAHRVEIHPKKSIKRKEAKRSKEVNYNSNPACEGWKSNILPKDLEPILKKHGVENELRTGKRLSEAHNQQSLDTFHEDDQQSLKDSLHGTISNEHLASNLLDVSENPDDFKLRERLYYRTGENCVTPWSVERF